MAPDSMLSQLLSFPPHPPPQHPLPNKQYEAGIRVLLGYIEGLPANKLTALVSGNDTLLDIIDPSINSVSYLFSLIAHANATHERAIVPTTKLWHYMIKFIESFDPVQVRYCGHKFRQMLELAYKGSGKSPEQAVQPVINAILRLDPTASTLTSVHLLTVEVCLRRRAFAPALALLQKNIYHLPGPKGTEFNYPSQLCDSSARSANFMNVHHGFTTALTYQDYLKYFLYGASIFIACKQWKRALNFLDIVLATPVVGSSISMIQVEAYKRWCLVFILVNGRAGRSPRNMMQQALKQCQNLAKAYSVLGDIFSLMDTERLQAEIDAGPFEKDCNLSLAKYVVSAQYRHAISNLSRTYTRLPLRLIPGLIGRKDSVAETYNYIQELITSRQLHARLVEPHQSADHGESVLELPIEAIDTQSEDDLLADQLAQKERLVDLQERMIEAQRRIETSKEYLTAARKLQKSEANKKEGPGVLDDDEMLTEE